MTGVDNMAGKIVPRYPEAMSFPKEDLQ